MDKHTQVLKNHFEEMRKSIKEHYKPTPEGLAEDRFILFHKKARNLRHEFADEGITNGLTFELGVYKEELKKVMLECEQYKKQIK